MSLFCDVMPAVVTDTGQLWHTKMRQMQRSEKKKKKKSIGWISLKLKLADMCPTARSRISRLNQMTGIWMVVFLNQLLLPFDIAGHFQLFAELISFGWNVKDGHPADQELTCSFSTYFYSEDITASQWRHHCWGFRAKRDFKIWVQVFCSPAAPLLHISGLSC